MRLDLVRHGRPAHIPAGALDAAEYRRWRQAYDTVGLAPGEVPPDPLRELAERAGAIVSSDLPRALESARRLAPKARVIPEALLREPFPPIPRLGPWRYPLFVWRLTSGLVWRLGFSGSTEPLSQARARAGEAADWLIALAAEQGNVIAITHGGFRRLLCTAMRARGWVRQGSSARHYWGSWTMVPRKRSSGGAERPCQLRSARPDAPERVRIPLLYEVVAGSVISVGDSRTGGVATPTAPSGLLPQQ